MITTLNAPALRVQFDELLRANLKIAFTVARRLTGNTEDAEDLLQEACLRAYKGFAVYESRDQFRAWFLKIITNTYLSRYRQFKRVQDQVGIDDTSELYLYQMAKRSGLAKRGSDPAAEIVSKLEAERIEEAIRALPEEFRIVAMLYFVEEFAYQEIADIVDCPVGTVRSRLHRARKALQKSLWELAGPCAAQGQGARGGKL